VSRHDLLEFAKRYTAAWCSQNAANVAACYEPGGTLTINNSPPAVGRLAIAATAQSFMTAFPDIQVILDDVGIENGRTVYRWTLLGTNTGPGGTGARVRISGYEVWKLSGEELIAESQGHFDNVDYQRQLAQDQGHT